jgi:AAA15 family ATPase/GTPase
MPYLSFLAINYDILVITEVQNWFESCIIRNYANSVVEHQIMISRDERVRECIIQALNDMGIDMSGYRFDEDEKQLYTQRTFNGKVYELPFNEESDGTKKLIAALPVLLLALQEGRLVIIDELDAKLHPKLLRYVISLFKNPMLNTNGAQLLFTSHDMTTMKNTVFRRDEIWFAAENENHESEIYSLYEIRREDNERVNSTAAYDKQYMEGRYGADPYLSNMLTGGEWT